MKLAKLIYSELQRISVQQWVRTLTKIQVQTGGGPSLWSARGWDMPAD
jgi:hypothetical protein